MDLFSSLPDEILCHILSFLTTKEAALASVVSKRWRNQFALVPNLDVDDSVFMYPEEGKREREEILQSFMDFVDNVLALQGDSPIKKFSLKCKTGVHPRRVDGWICNVLQRGVLDMDLFIDFDEEYFMPTFPVLEELSMSFNEWTDWDETVSSASLRKLSIWTTGCEDFSNPKSISFDIPSLVYFAYCDIVAEDYPKVNLTNLVEARISLLLTEDQIKRRRAPNNNEDDVLLRLRNGWKLMSGIRNVQKLYISLDTLEVLSLCCKSIPVFNNLKLLHVKTAANEGWQGMPALLRNCPHLETLVFEGLRHFVTDKCGDACDCVSREDKGRSLASCPVKKLQIKGFRGTIRELEMIKHFLESFRCLEKVEIYAEEKGRTDLEVPGVRELIAQMLRLYNEFYSCDVQFLVLSSLDKKWTAQ
ncbi:F-box domain [Arabidopsis thaliana x Arabidopsis arenosa]|uniref:F-box domain n=1 Tax=Arabidopsis thaliana x Arabidopsis arenosa TaxID=1240361 RepID=A0A8T1ZPL2_9BRAS|nr:F-box domain [Arabidopsis thaliana x Arabidopsis arenosa]